MDLKTRKVVCFVIIGILILLLMTMGITRNPIFGYIAIAVLGGYGVFHYVFWRCPNCGKNMGPLWVKCCPNCGGRVNQ